VRQVIIVTLCLVFVTLVAIIIGLKYQDEKTLGSSDLYFAAKNVSSYGSEAALIAEKSQQQLAMGPYRQVYVRQLADDVRQVKDKLATHQAAKNVQPKVSKLAAICDRLSETLALFERTPSDQAFATHADELQQLAQQAQMIEDSL